MIIECTACRLRYDTRAYAPGEKVRCRCGATLEVPSAPAASALNCPQCGSAPEQGARRCGYCGVELSLSQCPRCFGAIFRGARHCAHCGAKAEDGARQVPAPESRLCCPRCGETQVLSARTAGGLLLEECAACGGLFVDKAALERTVADREQQSALLAGGLGVGPAPALAGEVKVSYLKCPECNRMMARSNFGRISGVIVDVCRAHGTWFDQDELRRVVEFVMQGGLERSRVQRIAELERELASKEKLKAMGPNERGPGMGLGPWSDGPSSASLASALVDLAADLWNLLR